MFLSIQDRHYHHSSPYSGEPRVANGDGVVTRSLSGG
jgi:hypothetical protein